eukprot:7119555-Alexandrium_andersonii.AAC.1
MAMTPLQSPLGTTSRLPTSAVPWARALWQGKLGRRFAASRVAVWKHLRLEYSAGREAASRGL